MLDAQNAFRQMSDEDLDIYWGRMSALGVVPISPNGVEIFRWRHRDNAVLRLSVETTEKLRLRARGVAIRGRFIWCRLRKPAPFVPVASLDQGLRPTVFFGAISLSR